MSKLHATQQTDSECTDPSDIRLREQHLEVDEASPVIMTSSTASQGAHISSSCACTIVSVRMPLPMPKLIQVFLPQRRRWAHACSEPVISRMLTAGLAAQQLSCQARMTACGVMGMLSYQADFGA